MGRHLKPAFETTFFKATEAEVLKLSSGRRQNKRIAALEQSLVKLLVDPWPLLIFQILVSVAGLYRGRNEVERGMTR